MKLEIPLYTDEVGDSNALERFGSDDLGGPSGPRTLHEYSKYPKPIREEFEAFLLQRTGFGTVEEFADEWFDEAERVPHDLVGGLTHELSKFLAQGLLEDALTEPNPQESLVWDACGRADSYLHWIEMALDHGYDVEVIYVTCPLKVALARAAGRKRKLEPSIVEGTHRRAAEAARILEREIADMKADGVPVHYRAIKTSTSAEDATAE